MQIVRNIFSIGKVRTERAFRRALVVVAVAMLVLVIGLFLTLVLESIPSVKSLGIKYFWGRTWDPVSNVYGALPFLLGTLVTSFLALLISIPFSYAIAIYLGEYQTKGWLSQFLKNIVELVAAVPSVIYGFWALVVLVPMVRAIETKVGAAPCRVGIFTGSLSLASSITPYAASLGRGLIRRVPSSLKEGAYALGATR